VCIAPPARLGFPHKGIRAATRGLIRLECRGGVDVDLGWDMVVSDSIVELKQR
jgi:hypothetical protein